MRPIISMCYQFTKNLLKLCKYAGYFLTGDTKVSSGYAHQRFGEFLGMEWLKVIGPFADTDGMDR